VALIPERSLKQLFELNKSFWATVSRDPNVPQSVKSMIYQHIQSWWIPDALAVVISPLLQNLDHFLMQSAFDLNGIQYYYPSLAFWQAHANASHPPAGQGCDAAAHSAFLTPEGQNAEFIYAVVKRDGSIVFQDSQGFQDECEFFLAGHGK